FDFMFGFFFFSSRRRHTRCYRDWSSDVCSSDLGGDWDHTLWPGQPLPHHEWIDSVTPANPVFISRVDGHEALANAGAMRAAAVTDRKSTRLNSSHGSISYAVFCLKKKKF